MHKVAGSFDEIVYVDGFSGPWQSADEDFADTSFGIALAALRAAKSSWRKLGRDVRMKAVLVESRAKAFTSLQTLQPRYPDVIISPLKADFRSVIDEIVAAIPAKAFAFILIDPKGWRIPINTIAHYSREPIGSPVQFHVRFYNRAAQCLTRRRWEGLTNFCRSQAGGRLWRTLSAMSPSWTDRRPGRGF